MDIRLILLSTFQGTIQWQYVHSLLCTCHLHPSPQLHCHPKLNLYPRDPNPHSASPGPALSSSFHLYESECSPSLTSGVLQYQSFRDWLISCGTVTSRSVPMSLDLTHFSPKGVARPSPKLSLLCSPHLPSQPEDDPSQSAALKTCSVQMPDTPPRASGLTYPICPHQVPATPTSQPPAPSTGVPISEEGNTKSRPLETSVTSCLPPTVVRWLLEGIRCPKHLKAYVSLCCPGQWVTVGANRNQADSLEERLSDEEC